MPATATLGPSSDLSPIGQAPERRYQDVEEEGEDRGVNLDNFNFSLGYQTKLVCKMNNSSIISLSNLGAAPPIPSGIRGANYIPSHTYSQLTVSLGEQALVSR